MKKASRMPKNIMRKVTKPVKDFYNSYKNPFWRAKCNYIEYYETLPLDEKCILIESEHGTKLNGNMFYIVDYLSHCADYKEYRIYISSWGRYLSSLHKMLEEHEIENVNLVLYASDEYFRLLASAKYLFNDTTFTPAYIKKKGQVYVNTWHGTPLKALGRSIQTGKHEIGNVQKNLIISDYILFPNQHTRDAIMNGYMVESLTKAKEVFCGYPRNTVFFNQGRYEELRERFNPERKTLYAYLPTFRGTTSLGGTSKNNVYLQYYLYEIDRNLSDEEILYVNLHPLAQKTLNFSAFKHILPFPQSVETYEFLNICDCLITDYSSVFFDYAVTGRKIILFTYDKDEYLADRGMYLKLEDLPFPKVFDEKTLLEEMRSPKQYKDTEFLNTYCAYDGFQATKRLCDLVFLGKEDGLLVKEPSYNGKENVLIYTGNLAGNGITTALKNLLTQIDLDKRNYFLTFRQNVVAPYTKFIDDLPDNVFFIGMMGEMNLTIRDRFYRKCFRKKKLKAENYMKRCGKRMEEEWLRCFGDAEFSTAIQFNGYESDIILMLSKFRGNKAIFAHSDMVMEERTKGNIRLDVLRYAYKTYDSVAVVTKDIFESTKTISGKDNNIKVCRNIINYKSILEKAESEISLDDKTSVYSSREFFEQVIHSPKKKFISIGRFSPEKGHDRLINAFYRYWQEDPDSYLIIMGGNSQKQCYEKLIEQIEKLGLTQNVVLLKSVSNPYPILKACDYFVLSSYYEGFGLVLAEADILGLPVISTDITGPRTFMQEHGGKLVEDSEQGLYDGMRQLASGEIQPMNVDYEAYNQQALNEFETLFIKA